MRKPPSRREVLLWVGAAATSPLWGPVARLGAQPNPTQFQLTAEEVAEQRQQLEEVVKRSWVELPGDAGRRSNLVVTYESDGGDSFAIEARSNQPRWNPATLTTENAPERSLRATLTSNPVYDDPGRIRTPELQLRRDNNATDVVGSLGDPFAVQLYFHPANDPSVINPPSALYTPSLPEVLAVNNVNGRYGVGRTKNVEHVTEQRGVFGAGRVTRKDIDVMYTLQQCVVGIYQDGNELRDARTYICRDQNTSPTGSDFLVHTVFQNAGSSQNPEYLTARITIDCDAAGVIQNTGSMELVDSDISGVLAAIALRRPPAAGELYSTSSADGYRVVGTQNPTNTIEFMELVSPSLVILPSFR